RQVLKGLALAGSTLPLVAMTGCASVGGKRPQVVVVGAGWGGNTVSKYIRLLSDQRVDVTLIEPNPAFVSCPISNLVLSGKRSLADITHGYDKLVSTHGVRMVRGREEAEDLTQETFIKAFHALPSFNAEYAFSTWLYKIAVNNCIDFFRKKKLKTTSIDAPLAGGNGDVAREFPDEQSQRPDAGLIEQEKKNYIQAAINSLPAKYREAIVLRHVQDLAYEEISARLKVPIGTVKVRIFRAREMLKKKLRDQRRFS
nr:sigma-70 family RNA polymerase sigma factor [bacterium]